jgi:hypothetical protein
VIDLQRKSYTYGEFPLESLACILDRLPRQLNTSDVFLDIGSGCGRLVMGAALLRPWRFCAGVEIIPELHGLATRAHRHLRGLVPRGSLSPCLFARANVMTWPDPSPGRPDPVREASVIYSYSTTFASYDGLRLSDLSDALAQTVRLDVSVITTDKRLDETLFDTLDEFEVQNPEVGGDSVVYIARLRESVGLQRGHHPTFGKDGV